MAFFEIIDDPTDAELMAALDPYFTVVLYKDTVYDVRFGEAYNELIPEEKALAAVLAKQLIDERVDGTWDGEYPGTTVGSLTDLLNIDGRDDGARKFLQQMEQKGYLEQNGDRYRISPMKARQVVDYLTQFTQDGASSTGGVSRTNSGP